MKIKIKKVEEEEIEMLIKKADNIDTRKTYTCQICKKQFKVKAAYVNHFKKCAKLSNRIKRLFKR